MHNSNGNLLQKREPICIFDICSAPQHLLWSSEPSHRGYTRSGNIPYGIYYFYTAFLTVNAYCTASSYSVLLSVCIYSNPGSTCHFILVHPDIQASIVPLWLMLIASFLEEQVCSSDSEMGKNAAMCTLGTLQSALLQSITFSSGGAGSSTVQH